MRNSSFSPHHTLIHSHFPVLKNPKSVFLLSLAGKAPRDEESLWLVWVTWIEMGVWKARLLSTNLLLLHPNAKHVCWRSTTTTTTKSVSWSVICCVMLFGLGLISLLTGHVASHLEWYSHRLRHRALYYSTPVPCFSCYHLLMCLFLY